MPVLPLAAAPSLLGQGLLVPLGGAAAILAMFGMLMLLPLVISQRREIGRLIDWYERDPEAGDSGPVEPPLAPTLVRPAGPMTAAERVTSERPALARVGTAERAAIELEQASLWRRIVIRGPRHPLVLSLIALLVAVAVIVTAGLLLRAHSEDSLRGAGLDHSTVSVVVLNASSSPGLAGSIGDRITKDEFNVTGTSVAQKPVKQSVVEYAKGDKAEARAVAHSLGIRVSGPFSTYAESKADGAHVVVIAGDDLAKAPDGKG